MRISPFAPGLGSMSSNIRAPLKDCSGSDYRTKVLIVRSELVLIRLIVRNREEKPLKDVGRTSQQLEQLRLSEHLKRGMQTDLR